MKTVKEFNIGKYRYYVAGISVIGKKKIENQDSFLICNDDSYLSIVVADGLGSAPFSKEGSEKVCGLCLEMLKTNIDNDAILKLKEDWKQSVKSDFDKYDTTIKFLKISDKELVYGGIGDGWICLMNGQDVLSAEASHTFSNQTDSILSIDLLLKFFVKRISLSDDFVVLISTDGFSEDIDKKNLSNMLGDIKQGMRDDVNSFAEEMENAIKNWPVETNCDDKTVVFVLRKEIA